MKFEGSASRSIGPPEDGWAGMMTGNSKRASVVGKARKALSLLGDAVFPRRCAACGCALTAGSQVKSEESFPPISTVSITAVLGRWLCPDCMAHIKLLESPLCTRCGITFESREGDNHLCGACTRHPGSYRMARAVGLYERTLLELIYRFKYNGQTALGDPFGRLLYAFLIQTWPAREFDLVVPVPLHPKRFRQRGFNQAYLLVCRWPEYSGKLGGDYGNLHVARHTLRRIRYTDPQTGLGRRERQVNVRGGFQVDDPAGVRGKRILLVDDVLTTGATAEACARALARAGSDRVDVLTLARAVKPAA